MAKRKIKAEYALSDICDRYPFIKKENIETFGPVYYPIAKIEVEMVEKSFEDFDAVQRAVLRIMALGIKDAGVISDLMGLTDEFVLDMMKLLLSYEHIDTKRNITELGRQSIKEDKKILIANTKQVFLLDAINCNIVRIDKELDKTVIENVDEISHNDKYIVFLDHAEGIEKTDIERTLKETEYSTLKRIQGGMNINVCGVKDVRCLGISYVKSYLLKQKGRPPVIFVKRYNFAEKAGNKFYWLPFSADKSNEELLGIEGVPLHTTEAGMMTMDAFKRMREHGENEHTRNEIKEKIEYITQSLFKIKAENLASSIKVNSQSFFEYSDSILNLLYEFGKSGVYTVVDDGLSGNLIFIHPDTADSVITDCSKAVYDAVEKHDRDKVVSFIGKCELDKENIIESICSYVKKI